MKSERKRDNGLRTRRRHSTLATVEIEIIRSMGFASSRTMLFENILGIFSKLKYRCCHNYVGLDMFLSVSDCILINFRAGFRGSMGSMAPGPTPGGAPTKLNVVLISPVR